MNKKRLLSLVLSFALVFTTVFAGAGSVFAGEKTAEPKTPTLRAKMLYPEVEEEGFTSKTMLYSTSETPSWKNYTIEAGGEVARIVPIKASSTGWMYLDVKGDEENDGSVTVMLIDNYLYDAATGSLSTPDDVKGEYTYAYAGEMEKNACKIAVTKGKTYYVWIQSASYSKVNAVVGIRAKVYTTGTRTISAASSSKYTVVSGINKDGEYGKATWFKIKAAKSGVMTVTLKEYGYDSSYGKVKLYSAEKNARSETVTYSSGSKVKFGVKKGRTYYLKVTDCYGSYDNAYKYGIRYTISSATDRNIGSKSKAKRIYRKADSATKSLFVAANANSVDYYKFTVKTARKTKITVKTNNITSGYVIMRLYNSKGKIMKKLEIPAQREGYIYTTSKLSKGTYYVKITKSLKASGAYTIRWTY